MRPPELNPLIPYSDSMAWTFVYTILLAMGAVAMLCLFIYVIKRSVKQYRQNTPLRKSIRQIEQIASAIDLEPSLRLKRISLALFRISSSFQIDNATPHTLPTKAWLLSLSKTGYDMTCYPYYLLSDVCFLPQEAIEVISETELSKIKQTLIQLIKTYYV